MSVNNSALSAVLDRVIVALMIAIVVTLAWPVSLALGAQPPRADTSVCLQSRPVHTKVKLLGIKS